MSHEDGDITTDPTDAKGWQEGIKNNFYAKFDRLDEMDTLFGKKSIYQNWCKREYNINILISIKEMESVIKNSPSIKI